MFIPRRCRDTRGYSPPIPLRSKDTNNRDAMGRGRGICCTQLGTSSSYHGYVSSRGASSARRMRGKDRVHRVLSDTCVVGSCVANSNANIEFFTVILPLPSELLPIQTSERRHTLIGVSPLTARRSPPRIVYDISLPYGSPTYRLGSREMRRFSLIRCVYSCRYALRRRSMPGRGVLGRSLRSVVCHGSVRRL